MIKSQFEIINLLFCIILNTENIKDYKNCPLFYQKTGTSGQIDYVS